MKAGHQDVPYKGEAVKPRHAIVEKVIVDATRSLKYQTVSKEQAVVALADLGSYLQQLQQDLIVTLNMISRPLALLVRVLGQVSVRTKARSTTKKVVRPCKNRKR